MKKLFCALSLAAAMSCATAAPPTAPVSFNLAAVPVVTFLQATYKNVLSRDYVIAPEVLAMDKRFTISVKDIQADKAPAFVDDLLLTQGIKSERRGDVYYLTASARGVADPVAPIESPAAPGATRDTAESSPVQPAPEAIAKKAHVYRPQNRSVDFMVAVINAAFGQPLASAAGGRVVLSALPDKLPEVIELADALDVASRSVEVSASFVEVTRSDSANSGLSLVASVLGAKLGAAVGTPAAGSGSLSISGGNFQMVMQALQADGRFKQVSNSRVTGDESEKMTLTVGDETPTIGSTGQDNHGNSVQNIIYRPSGVILDVLPKVLGSGRLSLLVDGQISSFQSTTNGVAGSPTLVKRQVRTSVTVADGEVVILGGLDDTKTASNRSGFSFLPRSWAGVSSSDTKTDLVLILSAKASKD